MKIQSNIKNKIIALLIISGIIAIILGFVLGNINNMAKIEELLDSRKPAMPSVLLDRNGNVITEFFSNEKRDMVSLDEIPDFLVKGLIAWEDESFYSHHGFNFFAIIRAAINNMLGFPVSGASTLTQQLARTLFLSNEFSLKRKIIELWYSFQLEKKYTKNEILYLYLNNVPFGYGINGVQAASRFFFNKDVSELTYAEAASLITVISNPTAYSLVKFPKKHKKKQMEVLKKMVNRGIITKKDFEESFNEFWAFYQSTSQSSQGAFFNRDDKAPYFSDYVLQILQRELPEYNVFRDGLTIKTTLDLETNQNVEAMLIALLDKQQKIFEEEQKKNFAIIQNNVIDFVSLLGFTFNLENINVGKNSIIKRGFTIYQNNINAGINLTAKILGIDGLDSFTEKSFVLKQATNKIQEQVRGAFLSIDNETGQILTMIGGKKFDPNNRFNYATQGRRQPGSAFKPFIYSAAFDTGKFTAASVLDDEPTVFTFDSDDPDDWYQPFNYGGLFNGKISIRRALRKSLNIPAVKVFYEIGKSNKYKIPLDRAQLLLGITSQKDFDSRFSREISTVLGTGSVSLYEMVNAYSVFANLGERRVINAIISVENRDGKVIYEPYKKIEKDYKDNPKKYQIISPQNAYIITDILKGTLHNPEGFLYGTRLRIIEQGKYFPDIEMAAKSGTTQNWSDGWIIGYSPKITAGAWIGFKEYGLSLGFGQDGSIVLGNLWVEYMRQAHLKYGQLRFKEPPGIVRSRVCRHSGLRPSPNCKDEDIYYEMFLPGTVPQQECNVCGKIEEQKSTFDSLLIKNETSIKIDESLLRSGNTNTIFDDKNTFDSLNSNTNTEKKNE